MGIYMHAYKHIIALLEYVYVCTDTEIQKGKTEKEKSQSVQTSDDFSRKSNDGKPT